MDEPDVSWQFGVIAVGIWVTLWVGIELVLSDGDVVGAGVTGTVTGVAFVVFYAAFWRAQRQ